MTTTIHRCKECQHSDANHERTDNIRCSHGYCPCRPSQRIVKANNPAEQIPTFPGYNAATGKWATR